MRCMQAVLAAIRSSDDSYWDSSASQISSLAQRAARPEDLSCSHGIRPMQIDRQAESEFVVADVQRKNCCSGRPCATASRRAKPSPRGKRPAASHSMRTSTFSRRSLLSCVYGNLARSRISDPWLPQLAGLHRYHWARNAARQQTACSRSSSVFMRRIGIRGLGSFALLAGKYLGDLGERPFLDAEFVLTPSDGRECPPSVCLPWLARRGSRATARRWLAIGSSGVGQMSRRFKSFRWLPKPYPVVGIDRLLRHATTRRFRRRAAAYSRRDGFAASRLRLQSTGSRRCPPAVSVGCRRDARTCNVAAPTSIGSGSGKNRGRFARCFRCAVRSHTSARHFDAPVPENWLAKARQVNHPAGRNCVRSTAPPGSGMVSRRAGQS